MKRILFAAPFLLLVFLLQACAGALPWNPQGYAGMSKWRIRHDVECIKAAGERDVLCFELDMIDGKEKQDVAISMKRLPDGTLLVSYTATAVKAFEGQALRAEVEKLVAQEVGKALPLITEAITKTILKSVNPLPIP